MNRDSKNRIRSSFAQLAGFPLLSRERRADVLRRLGLDIGPGCGIAAGCTFRANNVHLAQGVWLNEGVWFDFGADVIIGARTVVGPGCRFVVSTHVDEGHARRGGLVTHHPVRVGEGCFLGANVTVLPGVTVGDGCVIAAGAVITRNCAPDGLYGGVPARRIRDLAL